MATTTAVVGGRTDLRRVQQHSAVATDRLSLRQRQVAAAVVCRCHDPVGQAVSSEDLVRGTAWRRTPSSRMLTSPTSRTGAFSVATRSMTSTRSSKNADVTINTTHDDDRQETRTHRCLNVPGLAPTSTRVRRIPGTATAATSPWLVATVARAFRPRRPLVRRWYSSVHRRSGHVGIDHCSAIVRIVISLFERIRIRIRIFCHGYSTDIDCALLLFYLNFILCALSTFTFI